MRGKRAKKRKTTPDAKYGSELVAKFINYVMYDGKKDIATGVVYSALEAIDTKALAKVHHEGGEGKEGKESSGKVSVLEVFETAMNNIKPKLEIRSRRIGGANYQVPVPVNPDRQIALAMRWILEFARAKRKNSPFYVALKDEIVAAYKHEGNAVKKKEDVQKMAEANKAFAQFA